jgi:hypothetical protein
MRKAEIIARTLKDMGRLYSTSNKDVPADTNRDEYDATVTIPELERRLPDGDILTCEELRAGIECCDPCHGFYPHYDMYLVDLPDARRAWMCCAVRRVLFPETVRLDDNACEPGSRPS